MENGIKLLELLETDEKYKTAYIKAYNEMLETMPGRQQWIKERVITRLGDIIPMGLNKWGNFTYRVMKNPKLDDTRFRQYNTVIVGKGYWCQCYMGKLGEKRRREICSHVGSVIFYRLIEKYLKVIN
jgi:hypothetical protein